MNTVCLLSLICYNFVLTLYRSRDIKLFHFQSDSYSKARWTSIPLVTALVSLIVLISPPAAFSSDIEEFNSLKKEIKELKKALEQDPDKAELYYKLGMAYENIGDYFNAYTVYNSGYRVNNFEDPENHSESSARAFDKFENTIAAAEKMVDYHREGNLQKAIEIGIEAIKSHPYHELSLIDLSEAYKLSGDHFLAHFYIEKALMFYPESGDLYLQLAGIYEGEGKISELIIALEKAEALYLKSKDLDAAEEMRKLLRRVYEKQRHRVGDKNDSRYLNRLIKVANK